MKEDSVVAYMFGEHEKYIPKDKMKDQNQIESCALCDEKVYFTGHRRGMSSNGKIGISELPKDAKFKYMAVSCFSKVSQIFAMMMIESLQSEIKMAMPAAGPTN